MNPIRKETDKPFPCPECGEMVQPTVEIDAIGTDTKEYLDIIESIEDESTAELLVHPIFGKYPLFCSRRRVDCKCGWRGY